jgi:hypothetical protein
MSDNPFPATHDDCRQAPRGLASSDHEQRPGEGTNSLIVDSAAPAVEVGAEHVAALFHSSTVRSM